MDKRSSSKLRSVSFDSNVLLDILEFSRQYQNSTFGSLPEKEKLRLSDSYSAMVFLLDMKVSFVGLKIVKRELSVNAAASALYGALFPTVPNLPREMRHYVSAYEKEGLPSADSVVMASCSLAKVDLLLSWNREHISNEATAEAVRKINSRRGSPTPLLLDPTYFLDRAKESDNRTLCFFNQPVLRIYRFRFYSPK